MCPVDGLTQGAGTRRHIDLGHGPVSHYLDTRDVFVFADTIAGQGKAALKKEKEGWELIPAMDFVEFAFAPQVVGIQDRNVEVHAIDEQGNEVAPPTIRHSRGMVHVLRDNDGAFKYLLRPGDDGAPKPVHCATRLAIAGRTIEAALPADVDVNADQINWIIATDEYNASATVQGGTLTAVVPRDAPPGQHAWLRIGTANADLWLDFVTAAPQQGPTSRKSQ